MVLPKDIDLLTILPKNPISKRIVHNALNSRMLYGIVFGAISSISDIFINLIGLSIKNDALSYSEFKSYIPIISNAAISLSLITFYIICKRIIGIRSIISFITPLSYSIFITEAYIISDDCEEIYMMQFSILL